MEYGTVKERPENDFVSGEGAIGISASNITASEAEYYDIPQGVLVVQINKDGNGIMLAITFLFAAQCVNAPLSIGVLLRVILISLILTTGAGGVPGGGIVSIAIVVEAFGLPLEVVALVSGIFSLIDMGYTMMNCLGDLVGTVIVANSEKKRITN